VKALEAQLAASLAGEVEARQARLNDLAAKPASSPPGREEDLLERITCLQTEQDGYKAEAAESQRKAGDLERNLEASHGKIRELRNELAAVTAAVMGLQGELRAAEEAAGASAAAAATQVGMHADADMLLPEVHLCARSMSVLCACKLHS
jgi:uncharacterized coiled-coil DUF342 family protein